ncbi:unnamed protein product [Amoebophrya sp. A25]|nr:unnamed protein product [Amoebophrya sp. A25]|eukprot:GSA25T00004457001.1
MDHSLRGTRGTSNKSKPKLGPQKHEDSRFDKLQEDNALLRKELSEKQYEVDYWREKWQKATGKEPRSGEGKPPKGRIRELKPQRSLYESASASYGVEDAKRAAFDKMMGGGGGSSRSGVTRRETSGGDRGVRRSASAREPQRHLAGAEKSSSSTANKNGGAHLLTKMDGVVDGERNRQQNGASKDEPMQDAQLQGAASRGNKVEQEAPIAPPDTRNREALLLEFFRVLEDNRTPSTGSTNNAAPLMDMDQGDKMDVDCEGTTNVDGATAVKSHSSLLGGGGAGQTSESKKARGRTEEDDESSGTADAHREINDDSNMSRSRGCFNTTTGDTTGADDNNSSGWSADKCSVFDIVNLIRSFRDCTIGDLLNDIRSCVWDCRFERSPPEAWDDEEFPNREQYVHLLIARSLLCLEGVRLYRLWAGQKKGGDEQEEHMEEKEYCEYAGKYLNAALMLLDELKEDRPDLGFGDHNDFFNGIVVPLYRRNWDQGFDTKRLDKLLKNARAVPSETLLLPKGQSCVVPRSNLAPEDAVGDSAALYTVRGVEAFSSCKRYIYAKPNLNEDHLNTVIRICVNEDDEDGSDMDSVPRGALEDLEEPGSGDPATPVAGSDKKLVAVGSRSVPKKRQAANAPAGRGAVGGALGVGGAKSSAVGRNDKKADAGGNSTSMRARGANGGGKYKKLERHASLSDVINDAKKKQRVLENDGLQRGTQPEMSPFRLGLGRKMTGKEEQRRNRANFKQRLDFNEAPGLNQEGPLELVSATGGGSRLLFDEVEGPVAGGASAAHALDDDFTMQDTASRGPARRLFGGDQCSRMPPPSSTARRGQPGNSSSSRRVVFPEDEEEDDDQDDAAKMAPGQVGRANPDSARSMLVLADDDNSSHHLGCAGRRAGTQRANVVTQKDKRMQLRGNVHLHGGENALGLRNDLPTASSASSRAPAATSTGNLVPNGGGVDEAGDNSVVGKKNNSMTATASAKAGAGTTNGSSSKAVNAPRGGRNKSGGGAAPPETRSVDADQKYAGSGLPMKDAPLLKVQSSAKGKTSKAQQQASAFQPAARARTGSASSAASTSAAAVLNVKGGDKPSTNSMKTTTSTKSVENKTAGKQGDIAAGVVNIPPVMLDKSILDDDEVDDSSADAIGDSASMQRLPTTTSGGPVSLTTAGAATLKRPPSQDCSLVGSSLGTQNTNASKRSRRAKQS